MKTGLTCVQFEERIQRLLDSRRELATDSLLAEHCRQCRECRELLDSYQSLEDSFSGKLPTAIQHAIKNSPPQTGTTPTSRWSQCAPFLITLLIGIVAGTLIGFASRGMSGASAKLDPLPAGPRNPAVSLAPTLTVDQSDSFNRLPDWSDSFNQIQNVNTQIIAIDQFLVQHPNLHLYYRCATDSPAALTLQSSIQVAYHWLQENFFPTVEYQKYQFPNENGN
ncbi:MAG: hypothetical protein MK108_00740 [Mariniblastus sp.]|nr:hypothetical protein [Mariniblastus sp.]